VGCWEFEQQKQAVTSCLRPCPFLDEKQIDLIAFPDVITSGLDDWGTSPQSGLSFHEKKSPSLKLKAH